ncbi:hypothetical protein ABGN05_01570 [Aquibium sp. LZ166]|uniref:Uncharacterized protein n=1 Tax=Aquibium pacificus TaxID=3153579 RepID=A0ABV3SC86_9HYPH
MPAAEIERCSLHRRHWNDRKEDTQGHERGEEPDRERRPADGASSLIPALHCWLYRDLAEMGMRHLSFLNVCCRATTGLDVAGILSWRG